MCSKLTERFTEEQVGDVSRAFEVAKAAHENQVRRSGEPYINHPIAVANIVVDMQLDHFSIMSALLHDVLEDTAVGREELVKQFGEEVATIVDGLSKLNYLEFKSKEEAQAESFRKMLLAMFDDIRVIMIKLADRLHNMRTLSVLPAKKQQRIGRETLDVYAPIAHRLGMYSIKNELEDLGFHACYPLRARILQASVDQAHKNREHLVTKISDRILSSLSEKGIEGEIRGREKHLYSLYRKMLLKQLSFQKVFDMFALRVVVSDVDECYRVLGIVHQLYAPLFRRFKDYIAVPKENGYQSLHTVLNYAEGIPVEVQIRTREMDDFAESGIAAHWAYKQDLEADISSRTKFWFSNLRDMQRDSSDTEEFVEHVKMDLFPNEIYVFTPKGRIVQLPQNATPVDFAYAVHSDIGNTCLSARVDRNKASLSQPLESGQTVEIKTDPNSAPSPMWLNFVVTAKARSAIRHHIRDLDRNQAADFGRRLLHRALIRFDHTAEEISEQAMSALLAEFHFPDERELYVQVGLGHHLPSAVAERLLQKEFGEENIESPLPEKTVAPPLMIDGREGSVFYLSKCCCPIPGDNVQGVISAGMGVAVHRAGCRNVRRYRRKPKEKVAVEWAVDIEGSFEAVITVQLSNQPGALARITSTMSVMNVNIENMDFNNRGEDNIYIRFVLAVNGRQQLARIVRRLRNLTVVRSVKRENTEA
ncbi:MAG: bifunctional (p)ppGpp synthetase/guanosine-3',5'-bis(diphosphate) 3'-pyrophosphohydrolase [Gammaproteobacteria bacterium]|nr:bifunctional (p)ppGpp synthetase/guanosine-3',5'-bis(diphosphate) 3'-pyrophosphohydrolase [Gammaproteobacteria bacterium]